MNDRELKDLLGSVTPPAIDAAARERALHRSTVALSQPGAGPAPERDSYRRWMAGFASAAGAALVVTVLLAVRHAPPEGGADLRTLAQVEAVFPGQLNAVIERDGEVQLDLAGQVSPGATDQPVIVQLESGGHRLRVLSYSGRSITLELKGARFTFEALVTSDGGVVLSGDDFVWSSTQPKSLAGYRIQARPLTAL